MIERGIRLKDKFEEFKKLKFPSVPIDLDIAAELALEDGNLAGYVTGHLAHVRKNFQPIDLSCINKRLQGYEAKNDEEKKEIEYIKEYLNKMLELQDLVQADLKHN
ncbi:MAG: hypothetical protein ACPGO5_03330 [Patescibacteria group bacterium]